MKLDEAQHLEQAVITRVDALVIGAGPAGLMAAEELASAGRDVLICDAKPSFGRKFLMAGKSGLNLTKDEPFDTLLSAYAESAPWLGPVLKEFDAQAVQDWARGLGQELFTGTTGRVFPVQMKASPLLRAWLARLDSLAVERRTRWRWVGWDQGNSLVFETPQGSQKVNARVVVLALGGASWARLGSDGLWAKPLAARSVLLTPFQPANAGIEVDWSGHMAPLLGHPVKNVSWHVGKHISRGEAAISKRGLEGGGIYTISRFLRNGAALSVDLLPDLNLTQVEKRLARPRGKSSLANHLRKTLNIDKARLALLQEFGRPLPTDPLELAKTVKALLINHNGPRPIDEAISTAGGVAQFAVDPNLMLKDVPGIFCAGEMLDWEAPTGGYLLTACLATGRWAGRAAANYPPG